MEVFTAGVLLALAAIPVAILALAVAASTWPFVAPAKPPLADLVQDAADPDAERPRMHSLTQGLLAAWVAFGLALALTVVASALGGSFPLNLPVLALAPWVGFGCALGVLSVWPLRPADHAPSSVGRRIQLVSALPPWLKLALGFATSVLAGTLLATGLTGVVDPDTGEHMALPVPSVMDWRTLGDQVIDVVYTDYGITVPWPGWSWGLPTLVGMGVCAALLTAVAAQLTRSRGPLASALHDVDVATRRHVAAFVGLLAAAAVAASLCGTLLMVGMVLRQISGVPTPAIDGVYSRQVLAYAEPLGTLSQVISWLGWALGASALVIPWWAGMVIRELRRAERAARTVF